DFVIAQAAVDGDTDQRALRIKDSGTNLDRVVAVAAIDDDAVDAGEELTGRHARDAFHDHFARIKSGSDADFVITRRTDQCEHPRIDHAREQSPSFQTFHE